MLGQYEYRKVPHHPRANEDGSVYLHILIAEEKLGRFLLPEETVHHIDENKTNNSPDNLMVFYTKADHTSFHQHGCDMDTVELLPCGSWISKMITTRCPICGNSKSKDAKTCRNCYKPTNNHSKKVTNKPTKEELFAILQEVQGNFTKIGKQYGVTDNAIRKWCKSYNLPSHSRDYK